MTVSVLFIVNGEDVPMTFPSWLSAATVRDLVLHDSVNTGRPSEEWEMRDIRGAIVEPSANIQPDPTVAPWFYLSLRAGFGGSA